MIPIANLAVVEPHECSPGKLLLRNARYDRNPLLICGDSSGTHYLELPTEDRPHFVLKLMAKNLGPYVAIESFEIYCDHTKIISPYRDEIPPGALCLMNGNACIAARWDYMSRYVGFDGQILDENFEAFVSFREWKIVTQSLGENTISLFEYEAEPREG